jgi:hypothetical protein
LAYVPVPKDLTKVKTKVALNLTKRQLICFAIAIVTAGAAFFLLKNIIGNTAAGMLMIIIALPSFLAAMYEKDGQPFEKVLVNAIKTFAIRTKKRPYKTQNYYDLLVKQADLESEVNSIVKNKKPNEQTKKRSSTGSR